MSTESEPTRWLEPQSEVSEDLRSALADARAELPSPEVLARIEAGVLAKVAAAAKLGLLLKLFIGFTVVGVAALQYWPESTPPPAPVLAPTAPTPASTPASTPTENAVKPPAPIAPSSTITATPAPVRGPVPDELELLEKAQRVLPRDPKHALRLTRLSAHHHPRGAFVPEREALAIQALVALGRTLEATERFERLKKAHPKSAVLPRLEEMLGPNE